MHARQRPGRHPHILSAPCIGIFTTTPSNVPLKVPATAEKKGRGHGPRPRGHFIIGQQLIASLVASCFPPQKRETSLVRGTGGEVMQGFERRSWCPTVTNEKKPNSTIREACRDPRSRHQPLGLQKRSWEPRAEEMQSPRRAGRPHTHPSSCLHA